MTDARRLRWAGERGLLIDVSEGENAHALASWLRSSEHSGGLVEIVPGPRTVLAVADREVLDLVAQDLARAPVSKSRPLTGEAVGVEVVYDGADLDLVCQQTGLTRDEVVHLHSSATFLVDFFGFSPGLAFTVGIPERLRVPRLGSPRTNVPAGSVAIANEYTVIYPGGTPGGWSIIGRSVSPPLWDPRRSPPNLINVGDQVRFRAVGP
ncbi:5-oxoprolinase subunit B family protein [Saccharopolyspora spinosa]|uniref:KipI family sensor histidine kinase inhibitor n=1 Tax=Saccharopolyspora spinosa TaxID=60894 RepID=A0A2N3Y125_SACSN|nr:carboxyltransferase domain-containing protein [Saccharopolyspora spinosa]PKW16593.1 KipI family sensor histidine kinase inhibitor [Saccharopolyspora spinosa]